MENDVKSLPVAAFRDEVMRCKSTYIILEGETGSGKTVLVPQWFAKQGYRVLVAEPLIETVLGTAEYVAELTWTPLGTYVGYATGDYRNFSPETRILYCTDGLALVRELARQNRFDVLIIDELHEWKTNQSTLEAWVWMRIQEGVSPFQKVIVLSATMDTDGLARVRDGATVFKVPGRQYEIEDRPAGDSVEADVRALVAEGHDVLVFQPGWKAIETTIEALQGIGAELIPFHGTKLDRPAKDLAYRQYDRPKAVVSTNSLETGRTLLPSPGRVLAVVDSGMERRIETINGVESLVLAAIPLSKGQQRRGRTGRVGRGIYIDHCPTTRRPQYPEPEIRRTRLDQTVLRLAAAGYDATELPFFHSLDPRAVQEAKESLLRLGFMREDGKVTKLGREAARLGRISVNDAAMVLEAAKRSVFDDALTIAAIKNTGSLRSRDGAWKQITPESASDLLAELDLYNAAREMTNDRMRQAGIFASNYFKAKELRRKLVQALRGRVHFDNGGSREDLLKAIAAGMVDHLYRRGSSTRYGYDYHGANGGGTRRIARESVVADGTDWVVGSPFNLETTTRRGSTITLHLIEWVTKVDPTWLVEVAPQLTSETRRKYRFDSTHGGVVCDLASSFNGQEIKTEAAAGEGPEAVKAFAEALTTERTGHLAEATNKAIRAEVAELNTRSGQKLGTIESGKLTEWYMGKLGETCTLAEAEKLDLRLTDADVSALLGVESYAAERERIRRERPDGWTIAGKEYELKYEWSSWSVKGAKIALPVAVIAELTTDQLPQWEGAQIRVAVADDGYTDLYVILPEQGLEALREKIESRRLDLAWKAFKADHGDYNEKRTVPYGEPLPELPAPEIWDQQTGSLAYPALVIEYVYAGDKKDGARTTWYLRWFRTEEEATKARETATAKKREADAAEDERLHFDELVAEARSLYGEIESLLAQIDWERYQAYGLTSEEASSSSWYDGALRNRLEKAKKLAFGEDGYYGSKPKPTQALEALKSLKERLERAIAYFQENETRRPEAETALEAARRLNDEVYEASNESSAIGWDERREVERAKDAAESAFNSGDYIKAIEEAEKVAELAALLLEKAKVELAAKRAREAAIALLEQEVCAVCGEVLDLRGDGARHTCPWEAQESLRLWAQAQRDEEPLKILVVEVDGQELAYVEVKEYSGSEYDLYLRVNEGVIVPEGAEPKIVWHFAAPSEAERELLAQIAKLRGQLADIERELSCGGRVEGKFEETDYGPQFEGTFTGTVENRKAADGSGWSTYEDQPVIFARSDKWARWLDEEPLPGQTWICTIGFQLAVVRGKPVIVVNPQVRVDDEEQILAEIAHLEAELKGEPVDDIEDAAARLADAWGARIS